VGGLFPVPQGADAILWFGRQQKRTYQQERFLVKEKK